MRLKRVVLIGGSGFVGGWLARQLAERGIRVTVPTRDRRHCKWPTPRPEADFVEVDSNDPQALSTLLAGADAVVNLVGILHDRDPGMPYGAGFAAAHVELPKRIVTAMRANGVRRLVHISALCAATDAPSAYLRSKAAGENALLATNGDLDLTIFRPSVIFGPNDAFLNLFAGLLRIFPVLPLGGAEARFQPVFVGDVAGAICDSLVNAATIGGVYELGGPKVYTLRELVAFTAMQIGRRRLIIALPTWLASLQAQLLGLLPNPPMTPDNLRSMQVANVTDGHHDYPGWQPAALEDVVPGYLLRH